MTDTKRFSITCGQSGYWKAHVWHKDKAKGLRYGQSWYNYFSEFQETSQEPFPKLFYEKDDEKAKQLIEENTEFKVI